MFTAPIKTSGLCVLPLYDPKIQNSHNQKSSIQVNIRLDSLEIKSFFSTCDKRQLKQFQKFD